MAAEASTVAELVAKTPESRQEPRETMARVFMIVVAGGIVLLAGGVVYLGAFPPSPTPHAIERVLPNDSFHAR